MMEKVHYDIILFENFHSAFHHKFDVHLIARLLKSKGMKVAILNIYDEDKPEDYPGIDLLDLPFHARIPDDKAWLDCKGNVVKRLYYVMRFLKQQHRYMREVRAFIQDKADSFYIGSYHLVMPSIFFSLNKPCYYWGLRSYRMSGFWQTFKTNPFLAFRMVVMKRKFLKNVFQCLFVSNEIIKNEFIRLGVPEYRLIIREERCIEDITSFNPESKNKEFSLLVIGGLRRQKHVETTIIAFKKATLEESVLRLVGENHDADYERIIKDEMVGCNNIERINERLQYEDFNNYIKNAHFVLFADEKQKSSVTNGTMMESIINYTPFIAPNQEPYTYYVEKYGIGITYTPENIDSYSEAIEKAQKLGYGYFIKNIIEFQKTIAFDRVSDELYKSLSRRLTRSIA